jgi:selenocysteine lyase/cysteine desulfurase
MSRAALTRRPRETKVEAMATRREFLTGAAVGMTGALLASCGTIAQSVKPTTPPAGPLSWDELRAMFRLRPDRIHLAGMLFASHPTPVREAIEALRQQFDDDPVGAIETTIEHGFDDEVRRAVVGYTGGSIEGVALTDSTTMGLGLVYSGLRLAPGDEILTSEHDHYSTHEALAAASARSGATVRRVRLYDDGRTADTKAIVNALASAIGPATRVVALTWVHSCSGVKLPIRALADAIAAANATRDAARQIVFCVDGVHGFGVEADRVEDLGCDVFITGCHKWLFGPRGTGIVWGRPAAWQHIAHTIPAFELVAFEAFLQGRDLPPAASPARVFTPGGFHSYEHRYALPAAFALHQRLGPARVAARIRELSTYLKHALAGMKHVTLHTPIPPELSSGIICYEVAGLKPDAVVARLRAKQIITTNSPYQISYARITPALFNTPAELDGVLAEIRALA